MSALPTGWRCLGLVLGLGIGHSAASAQPAAVVETPPPIALTMPVTVKTDRPMILYLESPANQPEKQVLATTNPSGETVITWLPKFGRLRLGGPGVVSAELQLPFADAAELTIRTGCSACSHAGTALLIAGGVITGAGLLVLATAALEGGEEPLPIPPWARRAGFRSASSSTSRPGSCFRLALFRSLWAG